MVTSPRADATVLQRLEEELQQHELVLAGEQARLAELQRPDSCSSRGSSPTRRHSNNSNMGSVSPRRSPTANGESLAAARKRLQAKNAALRQALLRLRRAERSLALDPQLMEIRNKTAATQREVAQITEEVRTLENVRRQWRKGMERVRAGERSVSAIRGRQYEEQLQLRDTLRNLTEELKLLEKKDIQLHEHFAALQRQVVLNVTEKELAALKEEREEQERTIENLKKKREELRSRHTDLMDEHRRLAFKEGRAKAKMEKDIADLRALLQLRDEELGQLYRTIGRGRGRGRGLGKPQH
ncbi:uncharacterized protein TM35_000112480 [Trypanosoma theileri]|uniref:Uncharacterized protein n=1 Tax=Trypanosoma theileri TaxID=67003 RepID=A0A1X0NYF4_9TRYP|nr:uncharacterized protein TM35_000112480 [Trypanosoma theileri]ORC89714.1 hypothetical protein TM35_000112480 [Trypanosoma theileri]